MISIIAYLNTLIFVLLSALHFYWAFGGKWALAASIPELSTKKRVFNPGVFGTLVIAIGLLIFALTNYLQLFTFSLAFNQYVDVATLAIAIIFLLRAIGDFKYVGIFKKIKGNAFAANDSKIYIPLCLYLTLSCLLIVMLSASFMA